MERSINENKTKDSSWDYNKSYLYGRDMVGKFSWPPRPYTCSFCKREFRSAQALGGHMNVHRRDRARLRQSPPWDNNNNNHHQAAPPNPNFHYSSSSSTSSSANHGQLPAPFMTNYTFPNSLPTTPSMITTNCLPSTSSPSAQEKIISSSSYKVSSSPFDPSSSKGGHENLKKTNHVMKTFFEVGELKGFMQEDDDQYKNLKKGHEINVRLDLEIGLSPDEDDLDLELRLGYS